MCAPVPTCPLKYNLLLNDQYFQQHQHQIESVFSPIHSAPPSLVWISSSYISPWDNRTTWLGVKHQLTYLLTPATSNLIPSRKWFRPNSHSLFVNPFSATACTISWLKSAHIHTFKQYIWWSYNKSTFNTLHLNRNPFTCSCKKGAKKPEWFQIWHFYWSFSEWGRSKHGSEKACDPLHVIFFSPVSSRKSLRSSISHGHWSGTEPHQAKQKAKRMLLGLPLPELDSCGQGYWHCARVCLGSGVGWSGKWGIASACVCERCRQVSVGLKMLLID